MKPVYRDEYEEDGSRNTHGEADTEFKVHSQKVGQYMLCEMLGSGNYGIVYRARHVESSSSSPLVAIKILIRRGRDSDTHFRDECDALRRASQAAKRGARVVCLVDSFRDAEHGFCIVSSPLCDGGNMEQLLHDKASSYDIRTAMTWAWQILQTINILHSTPGVRIYHNDLHPRNVIFRRCDDQWEAYLADLGVATHNHPYGMRSADLQRRPSGSFVPPEVRDGDGEFDETGEVWSWGMLVYALVTRSLDELPEDWARKVDVALALTEEDRRGLLDLLAQCFAEPGQRCSMLYALKQIGGLAQCPEPRWTEAERALLDVEARLWTLQRTSSSSQQVQREFTRLLLKKAAVHDELQQHSQKLRCLLTAKSVAEQWAVGQSLYEVILNQLALAFYDKGEYEKGLPLLTQSLQILRSLPEEVSEAELARSLTNLAMGFEGVGRLDEGLPLAKEAVDICHRSTCVDDSSRAAHMDTLALIYQGLGQFDRASELIKESIRLHRQAGPSLWLAQSINQLAAVHCSMGNLEAARGLSLEVQDVLRQASIRSDHRDVILSQSNLGTVVARSGDGSGGAAMIKEALHLCRRLLPAMHPDVAVVGSTLGRVCTLQGLDTGRLLSKVHGIYQKLPYVHPRSSDALAGLCELHQRGGDIEAAMTFAKQCLEMRRELLPQSHPDIGRALHSLAECHTQRGEHHEASILLSESFNIFRASFSIEHPETRAILQALKASYNSERNFDELIPLCEQVAEFWRNKGRSGEAVSALLDLGGVMFEAGQKDRGVYVFEDALRVRIDGLLHRGQLKAAIGVLEESLQDGGKRNVPDELIAIRERSLEWLKSKV